MRNNIGYEWKKSSRLLCVYLIDLKSYALSIYFWIRLTKRIGTLILFELKLLILANLISHLLLLSCKAIIRKSILKLVKEFFR